MAHAQEAYMMLDGRRFLTPQGLLRINSAHKATPFYSGIRGKCVKHAHEQASLDADAWNADLTEGPWQVHALQIVLPFFFRCLSICVRCDAGLQVRCRNTVRRP